MSNSFDSVSSVVTLSFEEALDELKILIEKLEKGQIPLKEAISTYERGVALKNQCNSLLEEARLKIDEIVQSEDGKITTEPSSLNQIFR